MEPSEFLNFTDTAAPFFVGVLAISFFCDIPLRLEGQSKFDFRECRTYCYKWNLKMYASEDFGELYYRCIDYILLKIV